MLKQLRNISFAMLAATYFAASQITVLAIVAGWYSTAADTAVAMRSGPARDSGIPSWTPRTHMPVFQHQELSLGVPASSFLYSSQRIYRLVRAEETSPDCQACYFSDLCNKAPPTA